MEVKSKVDINSPLISVCPSFCPSFVSKTTIAPGVSQFLALLYPSPLPLIRLSQRLCFAYGVLIFFRTSKVFLGTHKFKVRLE